MQEQVRPVEYPTSAAAPAAVQRHDRRDSASREALVRRVQAEFEELPCLRLTAAQTQRLLSLRADICIRTLEELTTAHLLHLAADGRYSASH